MIQPHNTYQFANTFTMLRGENVIRMYECQQGCSSCCGPKTTIVLTNNRVISRRKQANCGCCSEGSHIDKAIFLRDIEVISEAQETTYASCFILFFACITCTWPLLLCSCSCCGDRPKTLEVKGGFGSELLTFKKSDIRVVANDMSMMILPFKERA
jgi:hypothetical protein